MKDRVIFLIILLIFVVITIRLLQLQVINGSKFSKMAEQNRVKTIKIPAPRGIIYDRNGIPLVSNNHAFNLSISPEYAKSIDVDLLSQILNIPAEQMRKKLQRKPDSQFVPVTLKENLSFKEIAVIEARKTELPGLSLEIEMRRQYNYSNSIAHVIGYLGKITEEHIKVNPSLKDFPPYFKIGQTGLEYKFDEKLRGRPGEKIVEVDALGRELRLIRETPPTKGEDLYLTIDALLQEAAFEVMENYNGAFVAVKPTTGEILAMVSSPSFDPNMFIEAVPVNYWNELVNDPRKPLINKAIQGLYPPGSTFKIIPALAALEERLVRPEQILVNCSGGITYGKWSFGCWRKEGHGAVNLRRALAESCDVYFYELGKILGINRIARYAKSLGLGTVSGFSNEEKAGLVPDESWKKSVMKTSWFLGDTFNTSIGQGFLKVTPLQMALVMATFVNGGKKVKPTIIRDMQTPPEDLGFNPKNLEIIKDALIATVNEPTGTAFKARSSIIKFGGKTGTAQVVGKNVKERISLKKFEHHAWFIGFAPLEAPEIAFAVIIEHGGSGGGVAAPVARDILERYILKRKKLYVED